ncbi:pilus assembly PilX family protein [Marinicellulosiphila megalodicopiae]|uniref:pilus assembly PilX family protein n=1 Tax=Marinicellulosiphila megalodicopiae TaxID=2724896 RepID=UPI003BAFB94A
MFKQLDYAMNGDAKNRNQSGSVLFISLIMLIVISMIGVSGIRMSQADSIMTFNFEDKAFALEVAEHAVVEVENWLVENKISAFELAIKGCKESNCFNLDCKNGLCLSAYMDIDGQCIQSEIELWSDDNIQTNFSLMAVDQKINLWESNKYHQLVKNKYADEFTKAKFIVEFICFSANSQEINNQSSFKDKNAWSQLFRITVLATGKNKENKVMLQSLFKQG